MIKTISGVCLTTLAIVGLMSMAAGCLGGGDDPATTTDEGALRAGHRSFGRPTSTATTTGTTTTTAGTGGSPGAATTAVAPSDPQAIIAAAQTPDGAAIPQPAGPNGACPPVVALLGFWSCPQIGQTCSYTASGAGHACICDRENGEGSSPSWVCD